MIILIENQLRTIIFVFVDFKDMLKKEDVKFLWSLLIIWQKITILKILLQ